MRLNDKILEKAQAVGLVAFLAVSALAASALIGCESVQERAVTSLDTVIASDALKPSPTDTPEIAAKKITILQAAEKSKSAVVDSERRAEKAETMARVGWFFVISICVFVGLAVALIVHKTIQALNPVEWIKGIIKRVI